jgi:hypothetical protein
MGETELTGPLTLRGIPQKGARNRNKFKDNHNEEPI